MSRLPVFLVAVLLLVTLLVVPAAAQDVDTDGTLTRLDVGEDGDAEFSLEIRTRLESDDEREAFASYSDSVDSNTSLYLEPFRRDMTSLVDRVAGSTDREMEATDFSVETRTESVPRERGVVEYRFTWTGFAVSEDGRLSIDGALGGYILDSGDSLAIAYPEMYGVESVAPEPDSRGSRSVRWDGPRDFLEEEPRLVVSEDAADEGSDDGGDGGDGDDETEFPAGVVAAFVAVVAALGAGVYVLNRRDEDGDTSGDLAGVEDAVPDTERVMNMVGEAGGKMKQKKIVEETGWSEAKVSQVTSKLEDQGEIRKLRMGRENVLEVLDEEDGNDSPI